MLAINYHSNTSHHSFTAIFSINYTKFIYSLRQCHLHYVYKKAHLVSFYCAPLSYTTSYILYCVVTSIIVREVYIWNPSIHRPCLIDTNQSIDRSTSHPSSFEFGIFHSIAGFLIHYHPSLSLQRKRQTIRKSEYRRKSYWYVLYISHQSNVVVVVLTWPSIPQAVYSNIDRIEEATTCQIKSNASLSLSLTHTPSQTTLSVSLFLSCNSVKAEDINWLHRIVFRLSSVSSLSLQQKRNNRNLNTERNPTGTYISHQRCRRRLDRSINSVSCTATMRSGIKWNEMKGNASLTNYQMTLSLSLTMMDVTTQYRI